MRLEPELQWTEDLPTEPNPYAVGSIWHTSWGYDQTNVEFYTVVRETAASVWLVPMSSVIHDGRTYPGRAVLWGSKGVEGVAHPEIHRKPRGGATPYLRMDYVRHAWPYDGGGCYSTAASGQCGH